MRGDRRKAFQMINLKGEEDENRYCFFVKDEHELLCKSNNTRNPTFAAPQISPDKSLCDWSRAIVGNRSEHTRHMTLDSVWGYKYKCKRDISLFHTMQTVRADDYVRLTARKQHTFNNLNDKISSLANYFAILLSLLNNSSSSLIFSLCFL